MWLPFAATMLTGPLSLVFRNGGFETPRGGILANIGLWIGMTTFLGIMSAVFFVLSLVLGGLANRMVIRNGVGADARILAIRDSGTRINDNPVIDFTLEVTPLGFPAFQAQASQTVSAIHLPAFQPGKQVIVKFVPETRQVAIVGAKS
jgi:hypothetical protein